MESLKITLKPRSSFASPLMSDTLFGNFCWQFVELYGERRLEKCLQNPEPFIAFSDGFPSGFLPKPLLKPQGQADKRHKKLSFVRKDTLLNTHPLTETRLFQNLTEEDFLNLPLKQKRIFKNTINRLSNQTSHLYSTEETFFEEGLCFDVYLKYQSHLIKKEEIYEVLTNMGKAGYGKDASTGKGRFEIKECETSPEILRPRPDCKSFMSLSHGLPDSSIKRGYFKTITKFPKHGGYLAIAANPFKNPIILTIPGSVFFVNEIKEVYGQLLSLSPNRGNHLHSGLMLPLFIHLEGEKDV